MEKLDALTEKIDKVQEDISEIKADIAAMKVIQSVNTDSLKEHMRRTELAEESIELVRKDMEPIKNHVLLVNYTLMLIGAVFTAIVTLYSIYEIVTQLLQ